MKKRELLRSLIDANKVGDLMRKKFETVDPETALSDVVAKMKSSDLHEIPVVDGKKLVGVISYGTVIRKKNLVIGTKAKTMVETTPEINIDTPLTEVAEHFLSTGYRHLPVTKGKAIQGIITRANVISVLPKLKEIKALKVADVMSDSARSIHEKDLIKNAMSLMRDLEVRTVPVVDDQDRLDGHHRHQGHRAVLLDRFRDPGHGTPGQGREQQPGGDGGAFVNARLAYNHDRRGRSDQGDQHHGGEEHLHHTRGLRGAHGRHHHQVRYPGAGGVRTEQGHGLHPDLRAGRGGPLLPGHHGEGDAVRPGQDSQVHPAAAVHHPREQVQQHREQRQVLADRTSERRRTRTSCPRRSIGPWARRPWS